MENYKFLLRRMMTELTIWNEHEIVGTDASAADALRKVEHVLDAVNHERMKVGRN